MSISILNVPSAGNSRNKLKDVIDQANIDNKYFEKTAIGGSSSAATLECYADQSDSAFLSIAYNASTANSRYLYKITVGSNTITSYTHPQFTTSMPPITVATCNNGIGVYYAQNNNENGETFFITKTNTGSTAVIGASSTSTDNNLVGYNLYAIANDDNITDYTIINPSYLISTQTILVPFLTLKSRQRSYTPNAFRIVSSTSHSVTNPNHFNIMEFNGHTYLTDGYVAILDE